MKASTIALHRALIRLLKGILSVWENWLNGEEAEVAKQQESKQT